MSLQNIPPALIVSTPEALRQLAETLKREPLIAIDTESNSLYAYRERVCLIQISTRDQDFIVDPFPIKDMSPLAPVFASPSIEKVFHAATYDLMTMKRDYGYTFANLFDTMLSARICGLRAIGLNNLLSDIIGVQLDKSHQRDDWGKRPLPKASLHYAQMDTHFLLALRDHFHAQLTAMGLWEEAREMFEDLRHVPASVHVFDPEGFWKLGKPNQLRPRQMAILRELYQWREDTARKIDLPPFKIILDKTLVAVAQTAPVTLDALGLVDGMTAGLVRRYGKDMLRMIERGQTSDLPTPPVLEPPADPFTVEVYTALREWRKGRAEARGVEADVIIGREVLWSVAEQMPSTIEALRTIPHLGEYRRHLYGEEMLAVIKRFTRQQE
ncbi:MAG: HRDC domain-containing protein [bacterium]|nr:HRDC domain-containing protein [bacterium]